MIRTHISSNTNLHTLHEVRQRNNCKPDGFWYEVDGDWRSWCQSEMPEWLREKHLYAVVLGDENVLRIATLAEFDEFTARYGPRCKSDSLSWSAVAEEYDGIEIAPYQYARRMSTFWYYPWDCASGCLWRPRGTKIEYMGPVNID